MLPSIDALSMVRFLLMDSISSLDIMANQTFTSPSPLYFENSTKFEIVSSSKSHESNYYLLHSMEKNSLPIFISILGIIFFSLAIMFYIYYYRKYNRKSSNVNQQRDEMFKYSNVRATVEKKNFVGQLINKVKCRILLKTEVAAVSEYVQIGVFSQ
ncbi:hypothetical protein DERF_001787 [Dermatophagoides farinae]|uniref:Uncharacterized protein n=1 Tax=Dermatophagoides farinae TaxID=6954 RepID=A0A922ICZ4_DERFA|nr:hypothetical protein DERF_001787 [Dermatophagoides farinae]